MEKKKILWALASLYLVTSNADASDTARSMEGIYLGGDIGYLKYKIEGVAETFPPLYQSFKSTKLNIDDSNSLLRVNVGFGHYWENNLFTGIELGYQKMLDPDDHKITNTAIGHEVDVEYSSRFDVGLLLGYSLSRKDLGYIRLGYGVTDVNISPHDIGGTGGAFHDLYGPIYGVGYSHMLNSHLGMRFEVNHLSIDDSYNNDKNDGEIYDITIKESQLQLGVFYNF